VNGSETEKAVLESTALFPAVREQLSVNSWARKFFFVTDSGIESTDIDFPLSGERISKSTIAVFAEQCFGK
jgi:hypothetical protein